MGLEKNAPWLCIATAYSTLWADLGHAAFLYEKNMSIISTSVSLFSSSEYISLLAIVYLRAGIRSKHIPVEHASVFLGTVVKYEWCSPGQREVLVESRLNDAHLYCQMQSRDSGPLAHEGVYWKTRKFIARHITKLRISLVRQNHKR